MRPRNVRLMHGRADAKLALSTIAPVSGVEPTLFSFDTRRAPRIEKTVCEASMGNLRIALYDIPPQGKNITVDSPAVWDGPLAEFRMECRIAEPLRAELFLSPVDEGWLVRGRLRGEAALPCDLCAEDALARIDHPIEIFISSPDAPVADADGDESLLDAEAGHVILDNGIPMLDAASLCWEEFMLALPARPLCAPGCKGLCARCGANLNAAPCDCAKDEGDPRLAVLRRLKIQPPKIGK